MDFLFKKGKTSVTIPIFIESSAGAVGAGLTGLAYDTSGLICYYVKPRATPQQIVLVTNTVTGEYTENSFKEISSALMPGWYRLDIPDIVCLTGNDVVTIQLSGAANMVPCNINIRLTDVDLDDSVAGGMSEIAVISTAAANAEQNAYDALTAAEAINADSGSPSQGAPPDSASIITKIAWIYASWRNKKTTTATLETLYADNGTTALAKKTTTYASNGTKTEAEYITGA